MLRFLFRTVGLLALAGAFAAAVMDGASSLANNTLSLTTLGAALARAAPAKFAELPGWAAKIHPQLWDPVLLHVMYIPASVVLALVGVVLVVAARPPANRRDR